MPKQASDKRTQRLRRYWDKHARTYDKQIAFWERRLFGDGRQWICAQASGDVLEVAIGTGRNLPYYPAGIGLTGIEFSPAMLELARRQADQLGRKVDLRLGDAQALALPDASFDTVVCTLSLCAIPDERRAIAEMHRVLRPGNDPEDLVFTGPGGGPGRGGGPSVPRGTRTVLSRHNLHRTYQGAVAKLADPAIPLRPTARRVLRALRDGGPQRVDQVAARLATNGRPIRPSTVAGALWELHAAGLAAVDVDDQDVTGSRWSAVPPARDPLLEAVDLHGAHDFRHTYATWLEDTGIPARVIDELMGHEATGRSRQHQGSAMGAHYRHTTPEMAMRVIDSVDQRLTVVLGVAEQALEHYLNRLAPRVF